MTMPKPARDLALRLGADPRRTPGPVRLTQSGELRLSVGSQPWLNFDARHCMATSSCSFRWHARLWPFGWLSATHALQAGKGQHDVTALGTLPLLRGVPGLALTRAAIVQYLADLPYAPDAMLHNPALLWRVVDANRLSVSCGMGAMRVDVIFALDADGRVASAQAENPAQGATALLLPAPCHSQFFDYRREHGRWVPFATQGAWGVKGETLPCRRSNIDSWELTAAPRYFRPVWSSPLRTKAAAPHRFEEQRHEI